jgi:hypothetical protein
MGQEFVVANGCSSWQVRFLVICLKILNSLLSVFDDEPAEPRGLRSLNRLARTSPNDSEKSAQKLIHDYGSRIKDVLYEYIRKIEEVIPATLIFLLHYGTKWEDFSHDDFPGDDSAFLHKLSLCHVEDETTPRYITLSMWYTALNCPELLPKSSPFWDKFLMRRHDLIEQIADEKRLQSKSHATKRHIMRMLHFYSYMALNKLLAIYRPHGITPKGDMEQLRVAHRKSRSAAFLHLSARLTSKAAYSTADEECSRLFTLTQELEIADQYTKSCINLVEKLIKNRSESTILNLGYLPYEGEGSFPIPRVAPWELYALCQHSSLIRLKNRDSDTMEKEILACLQFQTAEGLLSNSWDRANSRSVTGYFGIEASCVVASTLLSIRTGNFDRKRTPKTSPFLQRSGTQEWPQMPQMGDSHPSMNSSHPLPQTPQPRPKTPTTPNSPTRKHTNSSGNGNGNATGIFNESGSSDSSEADEDSNTEQDDAFSISASNHSLQTGDLLRLLTSLKITNDGAKVFNWKDYKPPVVYHPDSFFCSLDDSPALYGQKTESNPRSTIQPRHYDHESDQHPEFYMDKIRDTLPADELRWVSVADIRNRSNEPLCTLDDQGYRLNVSGEISLFYYEQSPKANHNTVLEKLWELYSFKRQSSEPHIHANLFTHKQDVCKLSVAHVPQTRGIWDYYSSYITRQQRIERMRKAIYGNQPDGALLQEALQQDLLRILCDSVSRG